MAKKRKSGGGFFFGLMLGIAVGAVLGVLFAPQSGEETRSQLGDSTADLRKMSRESYSGVASQLRERYADALAQGREASARATEEVLSRYNRIKSGGA